MRADYGFTTSEIASVAAEAACGDRRALGYLLEQAPISSWHWLEDRADVENMLTVRHGLTELHTTAYFRAWAGAAAAPARGDGEQLKEALSRADHAHHTRLEAGLVRATRGCPADWSSADFWDWLTAPLMKMAIARQLAFAAPRRYCDMDWVNAAAMSG